MKIVVRGQLVFAFNLHLDRAEEGCGLFYRDRLFGIEQDSPKP